MNHVIEKEGFLSQIVTSARIVLATMSICCLLYTLLILGVGQTLAPYSANGSLIHNQQGYLVGSELLAQGFSRSEYFWPRPSAVNYNASATGGSNLSPANPALRARAEAILAKMEIDDNKLIPADLVTASGSGMDPHITLSAAKFQAERVALARKLPVSVIVELLAKQGNRPGGVFGSEPLINVLLVNKAMDSLEK